MTDSDNSKADEGAAMGGGSPRKKKVVKKAVKKLPAKKVEKTLKKVPVKKVAPKVATRAATGRTKPSAARKASTTAVSRASSRPTSRVSSSRSTMSTASPSAGAASIPPANTASPANRRPMGRSRLSDLGSQFDEEGADGGESSGGSNSPGRPFDASSRSGDDGPTRSGDLRSSAQHNAGPPADSVDQIAARQAQAQQQLNAMKGARAAAALRALTDIAKESEPVLVGSGRGFDARVEARHQGAVAAPPRPAVETQVAPAPAEIQAPSPTVEPATPSAPTKEVSQPAEEVMPAPGGRDDSGDIPASLDTTESSDANQPAPDLDVTSSSDTKQDTTTASPAPPAATTASSPSTAQDEQADPVDPPLPKIPPVRPRDPAQAPPAGAPVMAPQALNGTTHRAAAASAASVPSDVATAPTSDESPEMGTAAPFMEVKGSPLGTDIDRIGEKILIFADRVEQRDRNDEVNIRIGYDELAAVEVQKRIMGPTLLITSTTGQQLVAKALRPELASGAQAMIQKHARRFRAADSPDIPTSTTGRPTETDTRGSVDRPLPISTHDNGRAAASAPHIAVLTDMLTELHSAGVLSDAELIAKQAILHGSPTR